MHAYNIYQHKIPYSKVNYYQYYLHHQISGLSWPPFLALPNLSWLPFLDFPDLSWPPFLDSPNSSDFLNDLFC